MPWGKIEWYVSGQLNNSKTMTVGMATVRPGESNPLHFHPNCDEILHVLSGRIAQTVGDETVEMSAGDTISIPQGMLHKARNIGDVDAKLAITFNNGWREVVGE
jgi:mannose-6-phosphate isomerase-like protein (cupin superfamily)